MSLDSGLSSELGQRPTAKPRRNLGQTGLQLATALIALKVGVRILRAAGRALQGPSKHACIAPEPSKLEGIDEDEHGHRPTAREQWIPCPDPAPVPPPDAKLVAAADLPISVYVFYEQFLSVETTCLQDHHVAAGQTCFKASRWRPDGKGGLTRVFTFVQPKKGFVSMPARCVQQHRLSVHPGGVLSLVTDMQPSDIPCADCFRVQSYWIARPDELGTGCRVEIRVAVPFSRWCVPKPMITKTSVSDCREFFGGFLVKVKQGAEELAASGRAAGASPFAAAAGGVDAEVLLHGGRQPPPRFSRTLSATAKASFSLPPAEHPRPGLTGALVASTKQLVHLHTALLALLLLLHVVVLLELFELRRQLGGRPATEAVGAAAAGALRSVSGRMVAWLVTTLGGVVANGAA